MTQRCLHCGKVVGKDTRRGLCSRCRKDEEVLPLYPSLPRGSWPEGSRAWTVDESTELMQLYDAGLSDREIAARLRRSEGSVAKRRQRLGMKVDPLRQASHRQGGGHKKKKCQRCGERRPTGQFPRVGNACRICLAEYHKRRRLEKKRGL